jgi:hypothetical protein
MMNQRALVNVIVAVAVGYLLISAVPQQVEQFAAPQPLIRGGETESSEIPDSEGVLSHESEAEPATEDMEKVKPLEINGEPDSQSLIENTRLGSLVKWWTFDIIIAFTIYWVARRRLG